VIELTLRQIAAAVGGRLHGATGDERVTGTVEFDTRALTAGSLFVALPGERVDGHEFAAAAMAAGAAGVLAGRPVDAPSVIAPPATEIPGGAYVLAGDRDGSGAAVLAALGRLARAVVDRLTGCTRGATWASHDVSYATGGADVAATGDVHVGATGDVHVGATGDAHVAATGDTYVGSGLTLVGVTGSAGKTSTKDLIAALLRPLGPTVAPPGSFNNELGHPWTVLRADGETRHLVLELSARGPGHVAALCRVAPPHIGVVLNVGSAHLGEFGSRQAIAAAKGELVEALPADGVAVLNADDELVSAMASRTAARVVRFGTGEDADVRAEGVTVDGSGRASFRLVTPGGAAPVRLAVHGEHQVGNALAAAAVALELGAGVEQVARWLAGAAPVSKWRMEVVRSAAGLTVINDAYNANPESVRAALQTLVAMAGGADRAGGASETGGAGGAGETSGAGGAGGGAGRSWAVLGPIGELGDQSGDAHRELGRLVARLGVDRLVVVGEDARALYQGARQAHVSGEEPVFVPDVQAAVALLHEQLRTGDVVLVKASRAYGLERVAAALLAGEPSESGEPSTAGNEAR
jgi:UDP-N-acetylmuramoyl-tripeptide--D-alanyl-D-alanine ligase